MIKSHWNEEWKEIRFPVGALRKLYAISNYGRIISYCKSIKDGKPVKGGCLKGYKTLPVRPHGKSTTLYVHKLVAEYFLNPPSKGQKFVIHNDYNKGNNFVNNLRWATKEEVFIHQQNNPNVIEGREKAKKRCPSEGPKLTSTQVMRLKKKLLDPGRKTKLRIIAKQFGISEMQLYRIRKGENWGHIKVSVEKSNDQK
jgi:hypothetical protein